MMLNTGTQVAAYVGTIVADWRDLIAHFPKYIPVIGIIILIEGLLSVDNAAVLATLVLDLPRRQRPKALKYGIIGAYVFRGICLVLAGFLVSIWWLKPVGGLYLLYLAWGWWRSRGSAEKADEPVDKKRNRLYRATAGRLGNFWATILLVELMDIAFSIDNVFAVVAYTPNIIAVWLGVGIGILAMRFVAQGFVRLIEQYRFLETCAYLVIALLGLKLLAGGYTHFYPCSAATVFISGRQDCDAVHGIPAAAGHYEWTAGDLLTTGLTFLIFLAPLLSSLLFNVPQRGKPGEKQV